MKSSKQYAVEVLQKASHGRYGKEFYFGLYVPGFNKKDAEEVALEILADMSFGKINECCVDHGQKPWQIWDEAQYGTEEPIGLELAEKYFSFRAYIER